MHIADVHLDSKMNSYLTAEKSKERKAEILSAFVRLIEKAKEESVSAVIIAGDLFDVSRVSAGTLKTVLGAFSSCPDIEFYYLKGNHDNKDAFGSMEEMPENLHLFSEEWVSYNLSERIVITGIELAGRNSDEVESELLLDTDKLNIVTMHGTVAAASVKGGSEIINIKNLKNKGIDYLALGHIHSFSNEKLDARGVYVYPGCPFGRGFDECGEKGYMILDINETSGIVKTEYKIFPARRCYAPEIDISGCENNMDILDRIREELGKEPFDKSNLIEAVLTGSINALNDIDTVFLEKSLEDKFYFIRIKNMTKPYVDANAFKLDASLRGEFVRTVMADEALSMEDKAGIVSLGLSALLGEKV